MINVLASYSNIDAYGCILTGQYKAYNGLISNNIVYLHSHEENRCLTSLHLHQNNKNNIISYIPKHAQIFSYAVSLIPFLSHNDPTRALMAANMQKQAIPLAMPQAPLIGTGEERSVMHNTYNNIIAKATGIITSVDCTKIVIYEVIQNKYRAYLLPKPEMCHQQTCFKLRPIVYPLQAIKKGETLAECQSSDNGEMSLGANLLIALICWNGFNYEDSVLISKSIVENGTFNSLHIMDLESKVIKNQFGKDLLTNNISSAPRKWLLNNGVIKVGSIVFKNDVLIGKLSPIGPLIEQHKNSKLNNNMWDTSLRVPE